MRDTLFSEEQEIQSFTFNDKVVEVFPDMINRSVPGYTAMLSAICTLADFHLPDNGVTYDLGCSIGAVSVLLSQTLSKMSNSIIAIDNSTAMVNKLNKRLSQLSGLNAAIDVKEEDINETKFDDCDLVILNLTLQFITPEKRETLLQKIYQKLEPNGAVIICDKVIFDNDVKQEQFRLWHEHFKRCQGYNEMEISQKRASIMNVLIPDSPETHINRLKKIGFSKVDTFFQAFNFLGFIAVK